MGKIYFVRHGETQANTGEHFDQEQLIRLTANGHKQAKKVARKIKRPSKFFASLYFRTLETAQYAMGHHKNIPLQILPHVHEFSYLEHDEDINSKLHLTHEEKYNR
jgi:broad specificity phosphatase PhoE